MRTYVITGGTDGMGRALGMLLLRRGDRVLAVASGRAKGEAFLAEAEAAGAGERAEFLRADLSTVSGMDRVVDGVRARTEVLDGLVLGAQRFRPRREETADGLEFTFALAYLSRFVLGHGLADLLERGDSPAVVNIAGPGGIPGRIRWEDVQLTGDYTGMRAAMQSSRCNDLLGVDFPVRHPGARTRYVLHNPGFVRTGMADPLPLPQRALTRTLARVFATPASVAAVSLARFLDAPPEAAVTAFRRGTELDLTGTDFDPGAADRLHAYTVDLLSGIPARRHT
ncbi:SDR family NAD(P)-dependent oxidoreductase [Nocardiopsis halotolerans]|uniref:SDR family NAD(P)-dependent oxidoreductase n=1 Tax=Nocardiopsis halotolerans TaxID=124252 RepID=UPI00034876E1|nr:SDR family NAD(P)-dependent oxidoreductase [Nocardiopsis halotolerans]